MIYWVFIIESHYCFILVYTGLHICPIVAQLTSVLSLGSATCTCIMGDPDTLEKAGLLCNLLHFIWLTNNLTGLPA